MILSKAPQVSLLLIRGLGWALVGLVAWDLLIVVGYKVMDWHWVGSKSVPLASFGTVLSIIVGLRNSSAYGRWWEARTLWGSIVNKSRTLARQVLTTISAPAGATADELSEVASLQRRLVFYQVAYVHALSKQLRGFDPLPAIAPFLPELLPEPDAGELAREKNVALGLQRKMSELLVSAASRGWLNQLQWQALDLSLDGLMDAQGGAERIKNTPMPRQFDFFPRLFVQIYCLMLPVGMVEYLGWYTPVGSTLVGFMFLALEKIGHDLEEPFGNTIHDVSMNAIASNIEINLRQMLGETDLPEPEKPISGILW